MDKDTEETLAGMIEKIIKRYNCMEEHITCLEKDIKEIRVEMRNAAILLRDKHPWRIDEVKKELEEFTKEK